MPRRDHLETETRAASNNPAPALLLPLPPVGPAADTAAELRALQSQPSYVRVHSWLAAEPGPTPGQLIQVLNYCVGHAPHLQAHVDQDFAQPAPNTVLAQLKSQKEAWRKLTKQVADHLQQAEGQRDALQSNATAPAMAAARSYLLELARITHLSYLSPHLASVFYRLMARAVFDWRRAVSACPIVPLEAVHLARLRPDCPASQKLGAAYEAVIRAGRGGSVGERRAVVLAFRNFVHHSHFAPAIVELMDADLKARQNQDRATFQQLGAWHAGSHLQGLQERMQAAATELRMLAAAMVCSRASMARLQPMLDGTEHTMDDNRQHMAELVALVGGGRHAGPAETLPLVLRLELGIDTLQDTCDYLRYEAGCNDTNALLPEECLRAVAAMQEEIQRPNKYVGWPRAKLAQLRATLVGLSLMLETLVEPWHTQLAQATTPSNQIRTVRRMLRSQVEGHLLEVITDVATVRDWLEKRTSAEVDLQPLAHWQLPSATPVFDAQPAFWRFVGPLEAPTEALVDALCQAHIPTLRRTLGCLRSHADAALQCRPDKEPIGVRLQALSRSATALLTRLQKNPAPAEVKAVASAASRLVVSSCSYARNAAPAYAGALVDPLKLADQLDFSLAELLHLAQLQPNWPGAAALLRAAQQVRAVEAEQAVKALLAPQLRKKYAEQEAAVLQAAEQQLAQARQAFADTALVQTQLEQAHSLREQGWLATQSRLTELLADTHLDKRGTARALLEDPMPDCGGAAALTSVFESAQALRDAETSRTLQNRVMLAQVEQCWHERLIGPALSVAQGRHSIDPFGEPAAYRILGTVAFAVVQRRLAAAALRAHYHHDLPRPYPMPEALLAQLDALMAPAAPAGRRAPRSKKAQLRHIAVESRQECLRKHRQLLATLLADHQRDLPLHGRVDTQLRQAGRLRELQGLLQELADAPDFAAAGE